MNKRPAFIEIPHKFLYLTADLDLLRNQLSGQAFKYQGQELLDNISTDEITPGWVCFWYDQTLAEYCLIGLRGGAVQKNGLKNLDPKVIISGLSKGCGSSRETAPYAEKSAGVQLVVAKTIEKIYGQNCRNIGLLTCTDFEILKDIEAGMAIPLSKFTEGLDPIATQIVEYGGLFNYNHGRQKGVVTPPALETQTRPMTIVEKIIAKHAIVDSKKNLKGVLAVKPADALFCETDIRFSHEYVTAMAETLFVEGFGKDAKVKDAQSIFAFRDHLTFLGIVMPKEQKEKGLLKLAENLAVVQQDFVNKHGIRLFGEHPSGGSEAICHNAVLEELARPGQLVIGTDSHTCTAGALGCFAFGVGSTDMANAWYTKDVQVTTPNTVHYVLNGKPSSDISAKDVMLYIMAEPYIKNGHAIGKVLEFSGTAIKYLNIDERATLANMAVEAGATTGIIAPDDITAEYLMHMRGYSQAQAYEGFLYSDKDAQYDAEFTINVDAITPMVATPGDPRNGLPLAEITNGKSIRIDIAYGGSCTGGKMRDMDMYAQVLNEGLKRGQTIAAGVQLYIQFGSQRIKQYAKDQGYIEIFNKAGAQLIEPSCGACIKAGPGVSDDKNQVTISAVNRNYPGRSGPGQVYLSSPLVVAASALAGEITSPRRWFGLLNDQTLANQQVAPLQ